MSLGTTRPKTRTTDEVVRASISMLEPMPLPQLRTYWAERWGDVPAYRARDQILRAAAWKLQADAYGGGSSKARRDLNRMGARFASDRGFCPGTTGTLMPGSTLVREWAGKRHEVAVVEGGFEYDGQRFTSLSAAALAITGTTWNGPVFFGIKRRKARREGGEA